MDAISELFSTWWQKPFDANGNGTKWILTLGLIIVASLAWSRVLKQITES